jgi:hypothetical protein
MEVTPNHLLSRVREIDYSRVDGMIRLSHIDPDIMPQIELALPVVIRDTSGHQIAEGKLKLLPDIGLFAGQNLMRGRLLTLPVRRVVPAVDKMEESPIPVIGLRNLCPWINALTPLFAD